MLTIPAQTVLVPVDFSANAKESLRVAGQLLSPGGSLHLVHILDQLSWGEPAVVWGTADEGQRRAKVMEAMQELADSEGVDAELHVEVAFGNPSFRIAEIAERIGADLIVIPSRGRTGLARIALGSVAERVVRQSPCPVLVLRGEPAPG